MQSSPVIGVPIASSLRLPVNVSGIVPCAVICIRNICGNYICAFIHRMVGTSNSMDSISSNR